MAVRIVPCIQEEVQQTVIPSHCLYCTRVLLTSYVVHTYIGEVESTGTTTEH